MSFKKFHEIFHRNVFHEKLSDTTQCQPVTDPGLCNKGNADVLLF